METVRMIKVDDGGNVTEKADVHPAEVENYKAGGWKVPTETKTPVSGGQDGAGDKGGRPEAAAGSRPRAKRNK